MELKNIFQVIFTQDLLPYRQLETKNRSGLYDKKYRICFSNLIVQRLFNELLNNQCPKCDVLPFHSFDALKDHVRRIHEQFYCDICTDNLKIFSFERKCYTRQELALHRRKGDPDNTSHRGHPLCEFCDSRFLDRDELFRHLRREHYFCHFCDADGGNQFYSDYSSLRDHFHKEHYLCEEGDCAQEQFTAVFRSDIDLKAHRANIHSKSLGKVATKQLKTLEFEFTLAPRRNAQGDNGRSSSSHQHNHHRHRGGYDNQSEFEYEPDIIQVPSRVIDSKNEQEFPSLGGSGGSMIRPNVSISAKTFGSAGLVKTKENFPSLGGDGFSDPGLSRSGQNFGQNSASAMLRKTSNGPSKPAGMVIHVSNRPTSVKRPVEIQPKSKNDFPALPGNFHDPDPLPPQNHNFNMNAIASRHRSLVDDYVSVNNNGGNKLTMLQTKESSQKLEIKAPPKIASENNFPSLSGSSTNAKLSTQWTLTKSSQPSKPSQPAQIKETKSKAKIKKEPEEQVNVRKNSSSKLITLQSTKENNVKKSPTTKIISENNFPSLSVNSSTTSLATQWANTRPAQPTFMKSVKPSQPIVNKTAPPKENKKLKSKPFEDEDEPEANPSFDMSAFSAKHRVLADDYVSINPNVGTKLTMVQPKSSGQKSENRSAPKIESENNFPSLGGSASSNLAAQWNVPKNIPPKVESRKLKVAPAPDLSSSKKQENTNLNDKKQKPLEKRDQNNKSVKDKKVDNLNNINNNSNSISNNNNWSETAKKEPEIIAKVEPKVENIELRSDEKFPALGKQPPGFENPNKFKPPPGFNVTLNSVARAPSSSLTFTSSLGESYSILPAHHYLPPPSALKRNQVCFFPCLFNKFLNAGKTRGKFYVQ